MLTADDWAEMTSHEKAEYEKVLIDREREDERRQEWVNHEAQAAYRQAEIDRLQDEADRRQADEDIYDYR
jgi:hypothetical protein